MRLTSVHILFLALVLAASAVSAGPPCKWCDVTTPQDGIVSIGMNSPPNDTKFITLEGDDHNWGGESRLSRPHLDDWNSGRYRTFPLQLGEFLIWAAKFYWIF